MDSHVDKSVHYDSKRMAEIILRSSTVNGKDFDNLIERIKNHTSLIKLGTISFVNDKWERMDKRLHTEISNKFTEVRGTYENCLGYLGKTLMYLTLYDSVRVGKKLDVHETISVKRIIDYNFIAMDTCFKYDFEKERSLCTNTYDLKYAIECLLKVIECIVAELQNHGKIAANYNFDPLFNEIKTVWNSKERTKGQENDTTGQDSKVAYESSDTRLNWTVLMDHSFAALMNSLPNYLIKTLFVLLNISRQRMPSYKAEDQQTSASCCEMTLYSFIAQCRFYGATLEDVYGFYQRRVNDVSEFVLPEEASEGIKALFQEILCVESNTKKTIIRIRTEKLSPVENYFTQSRDYNGYFTKDAPSFVDSKKKERQAFTMKVLYDSYQAQGNDFHQNDNQDKVELNTTISYYLSAIVFDGYNYEGKQNEIKNMINGLLETRNFHHAHLDLVVEYSRRENKPLLAYSEDVKDRIAFIQKVASCDLNTKYSLDPFWSKVCDYIGFYTNSRFKIYETLIDQGCLGANVWKNYASNQSVGEAYSTMRAKLTGYFALHDSGDNQYIYDKLLNLLSKLPVYNITGICKYGVKEEPDPFQTTLSRFVKQVMEKDAAKINHTLETSLIEILKLVRPVKLYDTLHLYFSHAKNISCKALQFYFKTASEENKDWQRDILSDYMRYQNQHPELFKAIILEPSRIEYDLADKCLKTALQNYHSNPIYRTNITNVLQGILKLRDLGRDIDADDFISTLPNAFFENAAKNIQNIPMGDMRFYVNMHCKNISSIREDISLAITRELTLRGAVDFQMISDFLDQDEQNVYLSNSENRARLINAICPWHYTNPDPITKEQERILLHLFRTQKNILADKALIYANIFSIKEDTALFAVYKNFIKKLAADSVNSNIQKALGPAVTIALIKKSGSFLDENEYRSFLYNTLGFMTILSKDAIESNNAMQSINEILKRIGYEELFEVLTNDYHPDRNTMMNLFQTVLYPKKFDWQYRKYLEKVVNFLLDVNKYFLLPLHFQLQLIHYAKKKEEYNRGINKIYRYIFATKEKWENIGLKLQVAILCSLDTVAITSVPQYIISTSRSVLKELNTTKVDSKLIFSKYGYSSDAELFYHLIQIHKDEPALSARLCAMYLVSFHKKFDNHNKRNLDLFLTALSNPCIRELSFYIANKMWDYITNEENFSKIHQKELQSKYPALYLCIYNIVKKGCYTDWFGSVYAAPAYTDLVRNYDTAIINVNLSLIDFSIWEALRDNIVNFSTNFSQRVDCLKQNDLSKIDELVLEKRENGEYALIAGGVTYFAWMELQGRPPKTSITEIKAFIFEIKQAIIEQEAIPQEKVPSNPTTDYGNDDEISAISFFRKLRNLLMSQLSKLAEENRLSSHCIDMKGIKEISRDLHYNGFIHKELFNEIMNAFRVLQLVFKEDLPSDKVCFYKKEVNVVESVIQELKQLRKE